MGVDPAGGRQHGLLSQLSLPPQGGEELLRSQSPPHSLPDTPFKVGKQDRRAVQKGKDVHIPVAAAVFPVHQPRLRRHADLVQQAPAGQSGHSLGILSGKSLAQHGLGLLPELLNAVAPAPGAGPGRSPANQAPPGHQAQGLSFHLLSPGIQDVQVQQPANLTMLLHLHRQLLEGGGVPGDHIKALVACSRSIPLPVQARNAPARQLPQQQLLSPEKATADEQTVFTGPATFMVRQIRLCPYRSSSVRCRCTRRTRASSICSRVTSCSICIRSSMGYPPFS